MPLPGFFQNNMQHPCVIPIKHFLHIFFKSPSSAAIQQSKLYHQELRSLTSAVSILYTSSLTKFINQTQYCQFADKCRLEKFHIKFLRFTHKIKASLRDIGPAVRVFANGPGDLGSIPGRVIPKTLKMVLDTTLLNTQHYKVRFKGKVEQSWEWSSALPYTLV